MGKEPGNYTLEIHQKNTHRTIKNCHCEGAPRPWQSASPVPRPPCKNPCHCEPVIDSLGWQSASPVLNGPLPKGGRHGEAVTGGFLSRTPCNPSVGAGFSCPPSFQPTGGHCRGRQSGHFLEIASLHPPLAALRRFPRPVLTGKPCPARPPHTAVLRFSPARGRCSTITAQSSPSPLRHRDSSNISAASSRASVPVKPASRFSSHSSQL